MTATKGSILKTYMLSWSQNNLHVKIWKCTNDCFLIRNTTNAKTEQAGIELGLNQAETVSLELAN